MAEVEHYKATPENVLESIKMMEIQTRPKSHVTFMQLDMAESWDSIEGIVCMAVPDMLSGLWNWANYDIEKDDVIMPISGLAAPSSSQISCSKTCTAVTALL